MNNEKEIERIRNILIPLALFGSVDISEAAVALSRAGIGDKKQAVKEAFEKLKELLAGQGGVVYDVDIEQLYDELYGEEL